MKKNTLPVKKKTNYRSKARSKTKTWPDSRVELKNFIIGSAISFLALVVLIFLTIFFCQSSTALIKGKNIVALNNAAESNKTERVNGEVESNEVQSNEVQSNEVERLSNSIYFGKETVSANDSENFPSQTVLSNDFVIEELEFFTLPTDVAGIENLNFLNSPDGSKIAFIIKKDLKEAVLLNGEMSPFYDKITFMVFSPDSRHFAYGAKVGIDMMVVLDGLPGKIYDWIFPPRFFSPDSKSFIYKARSSEGDFLVFNETEGRPYEQIYQPFFNNDNSALIFYSRTGDKIYKSVLKLNSKN